MKQALLAYKRDGEIAAAAASVPRAPGVTGTANAIHEQTVIQKQQAADLRRIVDALEWRVLVEKASMERAKSDKKKSGNTSPRSEPSDAGSQRSQPPPDRSPASGTELPTKVLYVLLLLAAVSGCNNLGAVARGLLGWVTGSSRDRSKSSDEGGVAAYQVWAETE